MKKLSIVLVAFAFLWCARAANATVTIATPVQGSTQSGVISVTVANLPSGTTYVKYLLPNAPDGSHHCVFGEYDTGTGYCVLYTNAQPNAFGFSYDTSILADSTSLGGWFQAQPNGQAPVASVTFNVDNPPVCHPFYTAPSGTVQGTVAVATTANCSVTATNCNYFYRTYFPDGSHNDSEGNSWNLDTTKYPNGAASISLQIYNSGTGGECGSFAGQKIFGTGSVKFVIANPGPTPTPTATATPTPTPTATATPTPTPTAAPGGVSVNDQRNMWGIDTKVIQDSGSNITNEYANALAWGGWRWVRDDATHANTAAQGYLINAVQMAAQYGGAPIFVDELPVVDDNASGTNCTVSPSNPYCGVVKDTQYEWEQLSNAGLLGPFVELFNEPNNFGFHYGTGICGNYNNTGNNDYGPCVQAAKDIYSMVRNDTKLSNAFILGMSEPGGEPNAAGAPNIVGTGFDWWNVHNYWSTATVGYGQLRLDNQVFNAFSVFPSNVGQDTWGNYWGDTANGYKTWGAAHEAITVHDDASGIGQFGGQFKAATENGLNVYSCKNGSNNCTTRYTAAIGMVEGYLDASIQGYKYDAEYEMMERNPNDAGWGFFAQNATVDNQSFNPSVEAQEASCCSDGTPYAGAVMHNMTQILGDTVSVTPTVPSGYSVTGGAATTHSVIATYSSVGQFPSKHVAEIWDESFLGTQTTVTVNFGSSVPYTVYGAFNGLTAESSGTASSVQVTVSGELEPKFVVF